MYDLIVGYVETGDPALLELAAREALRSGAYLEHVLDLILLTPAEELPPSARRLTAGVKPSSRAPTAGRCRRGSPCRARSRRGGLGLVKVKEGVPELEALGVERVIYAFCKAAGVVLQ